MFCTKCGNEIKVGDLFCGKCGAKVNAEQSQGQIKSPLDGGGNPRGAEPAGGEKEGDITPTNQPQSRMPNNGLRKDLKLPPKRRITRQRPLSFDGTCRYCGVKLSANAEHCPSCGALGSKGGNLSQTSQSITFADVKLAFADVKRASEIGQALGEESLSSGLATNTSCLSGGCLCVPLCLINPFFWGEWHYRQKAREALAEGNLDLATELKGKSTKFAIAGWILTVVVVLIACMWASNSH